MNGKKAQYMDPVSLGDIMRAATVGVIVESKNDAFPVWGRRYLALEESVITTWESQE
jgi:NADPH-dependent curcumin reductase CurA